MPRKPRFYLPGIPAHIVQRGNCRQATFYAEKDYQTYLDWLSEAARHHGCAIHAYVLMTNHVHLLVTPEAPDSISLMIQYVGRRYVTYVNRGHGRSGTLWEGRHKGCLVSTDDYLFACMRYIELNPVRAGMVVAPGDYRWSSYRANTSGRNSCLLTPHPLYQALGVDGLARATAYRKLFREGPHPDNLIEIRTAVQTGTPLGNNRFRHDIEGILDRGVGQSRRGRPDGYRGKPGKGC